MAYGVSQGIGSYLMDAAQTFGDNLIGIFDRTGQVAGGAIEAVVGGIGAAAGSAIGIAPDTGSVIAPVTAMGPVLGQGGAEVINISANAMNPLKAEKDNAISMEWANADRGEVLGNLPRPVTPAVDMPQRGTGLALS